MDWSEFGFQRNMNKDMKLLPDYIFFLIMDGYWPVNPRTTNDKGTVCGPVTSHPLDERKYEEVTFISLFLSFYLLLVQTYVFIFNKESCKSLDQLKR